MDEEASSALQSASILRLGVFELVKMETAPHAAIYETVKLGKCSLRHGAGNLINGLLRSIVRHKDNGTLLVPKVEGDSRSQARALADLYSHPVWMVRRWMSRFGKHETIQLMEWNNKPPIYGLRANSVRAYSREALLANLKDMDVAHEPSSVLEDFVRVSGGMQAMDWARASSTPPSIMLDFEKAYDRVDWGFLEGTLDRMGFPEAWIRGVSALYRSASSAVTIGGHVGRTFQLSRSVRQGCPLAPYLFLFVAETMPDFIRAQ
ncbi:hypothetical protein L7F22_055769 [Adiantum nelumboides]|nr:hypothetical protein [Adiantum nelumboides]